MACVITIVYIINLSRLITFGGEIELLILYQFILWMYKSWCSMFLSWTEWAVVMLIGKFWFISDLNVGFENHNKYMLYKSILICWVSHDNAMHCFDSAVNNRMELLSCKWFILSLICFLSCKWMILFGLIESFRWVMFSWSKWRFKCALWISMAVLVNACVWLSPLLIIC